MMEGVKNSNLAAFLFTFKCTHPNIWLNSGLVKTLGFDDFFVEVDICTLIRRKYFFLATDSDIRIAYPKVQVHNPDLLVPYEQYRYFWKLKKLPFSIWCYLKMFRNYINFLDPKKSSKKSKTVLFWKFTKCMLVFLILQNTKKPPFWESIKYTLDIPKEENLIPRKGCLLKRNIKLKKAFIRVAVVDHTQRKKLNLRSAN